MRIGKEDIEKDLDIGNDDENSGFLSIEDEYKSSSDMNPAGSFLNNISFNDENNLEKLLHPERENDNIDIDHVDIGDERITSKSKVVNNNTNRVSKKKNDDIAMYFAFGLIGIGVILLISLFFIK